MLGELRIPDCYHDVLQGRTSKSVLAKFYNGKELLRFKRIYGKAKLQVLDRIRGLNIILAKIPQKKQ